MWNWFALISHTIDIGLFSYTERGSKIGNLARRPRQFFAPERAALLESKARARTKNWLRSRRRQKPIFELRSVCTPQFIEEVGGQMVPDRLILLEQIDLVGVNRVAKIFQALRLQNDVVHLMQRREEMDKLIVRLGVAHVDDELLAVGKLPDGPEKSRRHRLSFFKDKERILFVLQYLMKSIGMALIKNLGIAIGFQKPFGKF